MTAHLSTDPDRSQAAAAGHRAGLGALLSGTVRGAAAKVFRHLPAAFKGRGRLVRLMDARLKSAGRGPIVEARMKLGYRMVVDLRSGTEFLSYYTGDYDADRIRSMTRLFQPGWTVLDVGANVGFWTVPLARRLKALGGRVFSFEPVPSNFARLQTNVALNGLGDVVTTARLGLADHKGSVRVTLREDFANGAETGNAAIVFEREHDAAFDTAMIEIDTFDAAAPRLGVGCVDFIKVDIEGHEDLFFEGAAESVRRHRPIILSEVNQACLEKRDIDVPAKVEAMFRPLDFVFLGTDGG